MYITEIQPQNKQAPKNTTFSPVFFGKSHKGRLEAIILTSKVRLLGRCIKASRFILGRLIQGKLQWGISVASLRQPSVQRQFLWKKIRLLYRYYQPKGNKICNIRYTNCSTQVQVYQAYPGNV